MPENTRYYMNQAPEPLAPSANPPASQREPGAQQSESFDTGTPLTSSAVPSSPQPVPREPASPDGKTIFANENDRFIPESSQGEILVRAQTALGSLPVAEATVIVSRKRNGTNEVVSFQLTDKSGITPAISVPAPPKADSQSPSESLPFADYNITVRNPLYYTAVTDNVQVFGGEQTILVVELTPLPEFVNETNITKTVNLPRQNL